MNSSADGRLVGVGLVGEDFFAPGVRQLDGGLEKGVFVPMDIAALEFGAVAIAGQVAVKANEVEAVMAGAGLGDDVAEAPGDAASVAVIGENIGAEGTGRMGRKLDVGFGREVQSVGRELDGVFFGTILDEQGGDALFVGPEHGFVAGIGDGIECGFDKGTFGMVGDGDALGAEKIPRGLIGGRAFVVEPDFAFVDEGIGIMDGATVPGTGFSLGDDGAIEAGPGTVGRIRPGGANVDAVVLPPHGGEALVVEVVASVEEEDVGG